MVVGLLVLGFIHFSLPFILALFHAYSFVELRCYLYVIIKQLSL